MDQFEKYSNTVDNTVKSSYDYGSVMHYKKDEFTKNGLLTVEALQANVKIGQRYTLSPIDIQEIRRFYGCTSNGALLPPPIPPAPILGD